MAVKKCAARIEALLPVTVTKTDNLPEEIGFFLVYEGFSRTNGVFERRFGLYINGVSFNGILGYAEESDNIETALAEASEGLADIELTGGELVDFREDGTFTFRVQIMVRE